jgi:NitT/TauT family transport system substrate-binding protein
MTIKKYILSLFPLLLITFLIGCSTSNTTVNPEGSGSAPSQPETIRLGVMNESITAYSAAIGQAEGIFEKNGIKVETATFAMGIETIDAVTIGQMDIGGGADFAVVNRFGASEKTELRIFARENASKSNSWKFYTLDPNIKSPTDLKGKNVVTMPGTVVEYWIAKVLDKYGLTIKDVNLQPISSAMEGVALITNKSADAMIGNAMAVKELEKLDGAHVIVQLDDIVTPTLSMAISTDKYLTEHSDAVEQYLRSLREIYDILEKEPERAASIVAKALTLPEEQVLVSIKNNNFYLDFNTETLNTLESIYDWALHNDRIKFPYSIGDYVNTNPLKKVSPDQVN